MQASEMGVSRGTLPMPRADRWGSVVWKLLHHAEACVYPNAADRGHNIDRDRVLDEFLVIVMYAMPASFTRRAQTDREDLDVVKFHNVINRRLRKAPYTGPRPMAETGADAQVLVVTALAFLHVVAPDRQKFTDELARRLADLCELAPAFVGGGEGALIAALSREGGPLGAEDLGLRPFRQFRTILARGDAYHQQLREVFTFVVASLQ